MGIKEFRKAAPHCQALANMQTGIHTYFPNEHAFKVDPCHKNKNERMDIILIL